MHNDISHVFVDIALLTARKPISWMEAARRCERRKGNFQLIEFDQKFSESLMTKLSSYIHKTMLGLPTADDMMMMIYMGKLLRTRPGQV